MAAISSLAAALGISDTSEPVSCGLGELDPSSGSEKDGTFRAFQYFPETINDSKAAEWVRKAVPGGSHPILQFVNGGERMISFTAVFTQENNPESSGLAGLFTGAFSTTSIINGLTGRERKHTVNVARAIAWLRSFTYPDYDDGTFETKAPPFAIVYLPNSGIVGAGNFPDSIVGAMVDCNVVYEAFHRNGAPRIAAVNLSFVETVQVSKNWRFQGRNKIAKYGYDGYKKSDRETAAFSAGAKKSLFG